MLSIRDIVSEINKSICEVLPSGSQLYGVAYSMIKEGSLRPTVDEKYVGIDNTYPVQIYHKINSWSTGTVPRTGYGRNGQDTKNVYSCSLIVFNNQRQTKLQADELALLIQSVFPSDIDSKFFKSVYPFVTGVILNSQQVYAQEYKSEFKLSENESLFQINYTLEVVFNGCLVLCPEDFITQKN